MLKECWTISSKKLEGEHPLAGSKQASQIEAVFPASFLRFVKYENVYNYLQYP